MHDQNPLPWKLIVGLGALGLIRPILGMVGMTGPAAGPWVSVGLTGLIAVIWIGVVVAKKAVDPFPTLVMAGVTYGVLAILLNAFGQLLLSGARGFLRQGVLAILVTNTMWGAFLGLVATGLLRFRRR